MSIVVLGDSWEGAGGVGEGIIAAKGAFSFAVLFKDTISVSLTLSFCSVAAAELPAFTHFACSDAATDQ